MSTRAFDLQVPSKFESFKLKNKREVPETSAPVSAPADTLLAQMAIDNKNSVSTGNHAVIDFQGDFRPIIMALCFYAASFYDSLDVKQHSKVSPPTLVAYFLFVIYGFYLISDLEARPTPSIHTRFLHTPEFLDFKAFLYNLDVPDFLVKFLQAIAPAADPRRPNITYVPSFACYSEYMDFGRYFPVSIFLQCHNYVISNKTNDAPEDLINKMMGLNVYSDIRIGNFFGQLLSDGTNNHSYAHQLMQAFEGVINPALARSRSQRNVYSRVPHHVQPDATGFNPYQYFMNCDEDNVSEIMTLMRQIQSTISAKFKISGKLSSVAASLTGMNITIHSYSEFALPTWHRTIVPQNATASTSSPAKVFAGHLKFLSKPVRRKHSLFAVRPPLL
uniref:Defective capsid protein n=1 Tax=Rosellinia necatrix partitivirus 3 TaxID=1148492 RepID=A0A6F8PD57_9VIRU|nr:defective capsid protein [Rosellinia necatrix partitivirus 3]